MWLMGLAFVLAGCVASRDLPSPPLLNTNRLAGLADSISDTLTLYDGYNDDLSPEEASLDSAFAIGVNDALRHLRNGRMGLCGGAPEYLIMTDERRRSWRARIVQEGVLKTLYGVELVCEDTHIADRNTLAYQRGYSLVSDAAIADYFDGEDIVRKSFDQVADFTERYGSSQRKRWRYE